MRRALACSVCACSIVWFTASRPAGQQPAASVVTAPENRPEPATHVPVRQDPHHRQAFQLINKWFRAYRIVLTPGERTASTVRPSRSSRLPRERALAAAA
jgi:ferric-dicitrate binding protein FerR (iron transport regulator)